MTKCQIDECKTRASFGYEGEQATRCSKHKDDVLGLVNAMLMAVKHRQILDMKEQKQQMFKT